MSSNRVEQIKNEIRENYKNYNIDKSILDDILNRYSENDLSDDQLELSKKYSVLVDAYIVSLLDSNKNQSILNQIELDNKVLKIMIKKNKSYNLADDKVEEVYKKAISLLQTKYNEDMGIRVNILENMKSILSRKIKRRYDMSFLKGQESLPIKELMENLELSEEDVHKIVNGDKKATEDELETILLIFDKDSYDDLKQSMEIQNEKVKDSDISNEKYRKQYNLSFMKEYIKIHLIPVFKFVNLLNVSSYELMDILDGDLKVDEIKLKKMCEYFNVPNIRLLEVKVLETILDYNVKKETKELPMKIGNSNTKYSLKFLKEYVYLRKISKTELSELLGCENNIIDDVLNGKVTFNSNQLEQLYKKFDVKNIQELRQVIKDKINKEIVYIDNVLFINDKDVIRFKTIFEILGINQSQYQNILKKLSQKDVELINRANGENLSNPRRSEDWNLYKDNIKYIILINKINNILHPTHKKNESDLTKEKIKVVSTEKKNNNFSFLKKIIDQGIISNKQLCKILQITRPNLTLVLSGEKNLTEKQIKKLLEVFDCNNIDELKNKANSEIKVNLSNSTNEKEKIGQKEPENDLTTVKKVENNDKSPVITEKNDQESSKNKTSIIKKFEKTNDNGVKKVMSGRPKVSIFNSNKLSNHTPEIIRQAVNFLNSSDKMIVFKKNGETLDSQEMGDLSKEEKGRYYTTILPKIDKICYEIENNKAIEEDLIQKTEKHDNIPVNVENKFICESSNEDKKSIKLQSIFDYLNTYSKDDVIMKIQLLDDVSKEFFYSFCGYDIHRPKFKEDLKQSDYDRYINIVNKVESYLISDNDEIKNINQKQDEKQNIDNIDVMIKDIDEPLQDESIEKTDSIDLVVEQDNQESQIDYISEEKSIDEKHDNAKKNALTCNINEKSVFVTYKDTFKYLNDIQIVVSILVLEYGLSIEKVTNFLKKSNVSENDIKQISIRTLELYKYLINKSIYEKMTQFDSSINIEFTHEIKLMSVSSLFSSFDNLTYEEILISLLTIRFGYDASSINELIDIEKEKISNIAIKALELYRNSVNESIDQKIDLIKNNNVILTYEE